MKRGFPQKIEPLLPQSLGKDALDALMELATATSEGKAPSVDVLNQIRCLRAEDIASVVQQAGGGDWVNSYLMPLLTSQDCQRRLQTSAAVMGLALSIGASDVLSLMRSQALAAEASSAELTEAQRADELAAELQKLAESAATAVEQGGFDGSQSGNFSPTVVSVRTSVDEFAEDSQQAGGSGDVDLSEAFSEVESHTSYHIVQPGETVYSLARSYGVSPTQLVSLNRLSASGAIRAGQTLKVPDNAAQAATEPSAVASIQVSSDLNLSELKPYQVKPGDTVKSIARNYGVSHLEILSLNQLEDANVLRVDQVIALPQGSKLVSHASGVPQTDASAANEQVLQSQVSLPTPPETVVGASSASSGVSKDQSLVGVPPASSELSTYRVQPGDTLAKIARRAGSSLSELSRLNGISNPNFIFVGQALKVPASIAQSSSPASVHPREQVGTASKAPSTSDTTPVDEGRYISNLLDEIRQIRQQIRGEVEVATTQPTPLVPTISRDESQADAGNDSPSSASPSRPSKYLEGLKAELQSLQNSEEVQAAAQTAEKSSQINVELPSIPTSKQEPQIVAAAPLGSQSYEPLAQSLLSRSVSPELPPLLSEPFLPDGAVNGYIWPAEGTFTSGFGWRWGRMHKGIDIAGPVGTPIVAAAAGVVTYSGWNDGGYGNLVEVTHSDGSVSIYAHNSRLNVRKGQRVRQGQQIAEMGSTGFSTGPHLHFEIRVPGQGAVNPVSYLNKQ